MAIDALEGPPFPEALLHLWEVFQYLDAMRAVGFNGPERFTPTHIRDGMELFGWTLAPHEIEALVLLDAVILHPKETKEEKKGEGEAKPAVQLPWPTRKG